MENYEEWKKFIISVLETHDLDVLKETIMTVYEFEYWAYELLNNDPSMEEFLDQKFCELLRPFDGLEDGKKIYCRCHEVKTEDGIEYSFSALTDEMLKVDSCYYSGMMNYLAARNFFDSLLYNVETSDGVVGISGKELYSGTKEFDRNNPLTKKKLRSVLDLLYKPYYYSLAVSDDSKAEEIAHKTGSDWWEVRIRRKNNDPQASDAKNTVVRGSLVFAASPLTFEYVEAEWIKKSNIDIDSELNIDFYQEASNEDVTAALNSVFRNVTESEISVYRVGDANSVVITNKVKGKPKKIVFDLGLPNDCILGKNANAIPTDKTQGKLRRMNPDVFIISHWHMDHFKAAYILNRKVYAANSSAKWIAPLYVNREIGSSADRLVKYLVANDQIRFVKEGYYYFNQQFRLYRINTTSNNEADNNNCLVLVADKTVLPGDCRFVEWIDCIEATNRENNISGSIENIIVPHHGALNSLELRPGDNSTTDIKQKLENILSSKRKKAIVCTGHGYNNHPHPDVESLFVDLGFEEFEETNSGDDTIEIK